MIQKKICTIGAFAVGKTSLIRRYVESIFSEKYLTTVGVKIDKKPVNVLGQDVTLILWDIHGEDDFQEINMNYLRGSSGYILVVDGNRYSTLEKAILLQDKVEKSYGNIPFIIAINKADLKDEWEITDKDISKISEKGWKVLETSAKNGEGVEELFTELTKEILISE